VISKYVPDHENKWLQCLKEAFYFSPYYDTLMKVKPGYENPSIELVAFDSSNLVGFLDIEVIPEEDQFCRTPEENITCGQIALIGVHPDYHQRGIATRMFETAITNDFHDHKIDRLEVFFRKDDTILKWVESVGFIQCAKYYEITLTDDFFFKYDIELPFGINPSLLHGFVDQNGYEMLSNRHPPERTFPILIYTKDL
jgi:ribosomal protein S18 acetylase RimI-like enzyme